MLAAQAARDKEPAVKEPLYTAKEKLLMDHIRKSLVEIRRICAIKPSTRVLHRQWKKEMLHLAAICQRGGYDMNAFLGKR